MTLKQRFLHIAIGLDQFLFTVITLGDADPDETMSAAAYRLDIHGKWTGRFFRPLIDFIFLHLFNDRDHCHQAYLSEMKGSQLPSEYNDKSK